MLKETLKILFERDLFKLKKEIQLYRDERSIWLVEKNIANSAGNLCLHLIGNLNTYVGAGLGNTVYVRRREIEFSLKDVPRSRLIEDIEKTITMVRLVLNDLNEQQIKEEYPLLVFEEKTSTEYFLVHLAMHLAYHLGQINYHRRLMDGLNES